MAGPIVTLTTDFGTGDYYVGAMKGAVLEVCPDAEIIDITHDLPTYDILEAAFTLALASAPFPYGTIHVVVVDPAVGTDRRALVVRGDQHYYVAPDNGVLSFIYPKQEKLAVYHITSDHYFRRPVSNTFHGRDIFGPCAGALAKGVDAARFGDPIEDFVRLNVPRAQASGEKSWKAMVLKIDRFGNVITSITAEDVPALFAEPTPPFKLTVGGKEIARLMPTYSVGEKGEIFAVLGSSGYLEVAANRNPAAKLLGVQRGAEVLLSLG
jgi:hypothetical protein